MINDAWYSVSPEVAGSIGPNTIMDRASTPPTVSKLHYIFKGWLGGEIVESFPCYLVSARLAEAIQTSELTGADFSEVEVEIDMQFEMFQREVVAALPEWVWMKPAGREGTDDFWIEANGQLAISGRTYELLQKFDVKSAEFMLL